MKKSMMVIGLSMLSLAPIAAHSNDTNAGIIFDIQHKSKQEIDIESLPDRVKQTIADRNKGATISKAYEWHRGDKLIGYEVVITQADKKDQVVRFDKKGKLVNAINND